MLIKMLIFASVKSISVQEMLLSDLRTIIQTAI